MSSNDNIDHERLRQERDLYLGLLGLSDREHPDAFLDEALGLIVRVLGADQGYLEVFDPHEGHEGPKWWRAAGCSDDQVGLIRSIVSRGIIQEALALGEAIACPSAILDPRFRNRPSVQASQIEAVLCVPIVQREPIGVLYMQGRRMGGSFSESEVERARAFARHLGPLVEGLFLRSRQRQVDHVAPIRTRLRLDEVVGVSAALARVLREVELVAPLDVAVLVTGETGTGKTQLAHIIHENGRRRGRRFVELNCSAIPENLLESELFGAAPGAHSTAVRRIEGKVAAAEGGTLFLDEVAELSLQAQAKLLQFLHTKEYYPLGSSTSHTADVRIIAATNGDLEERVRERRFRSDLLFRLQVLSVRMPALSERREDVVPLAQYLCACAQRSHRLPERELSPGALRAIEASEWRGNVRELAHAVEAGAIRAAGEGAKSVEATHLFGQSGPSGSPNRAPLTFQEETRRFQAALVQRALEASDWNVAAAARNLDLTRAHLYNLIKAFGLSRRPPE
jgi:Nif-specific regulatory protein